MLCNKSPTPLSYFPGKLKAVHLVVIAALVLTLGACSLGPQRPQIAGGQKITQAGYSFIVPGNKSWSVLVQSTYQITIGVVGDRPDETFIVSAATVQIPAFSTAQDFLAHVKAGRRAEPKTGRFEIIKNDEQLYTERSETCVKHETESKDFGAKRGNDYSVIQYFGMNCIHPKNPTIGIFVELSRKAPPGVESPLFRTMGSQLLKSVQFSAYK
jgi:hypothetical protein